MDSQKDALMQLPLPPSSFIPIVAAPRTSNRRYERWSSPSERPRLHPLDPELHPRHLDAVCLRDGELPANLLSPRNLGFDGADRSA
ncbi:hypothetical protein NMY22_g18715 [Coprinellus aureogranulatus]|nr:hypothetical protein NMY22_g18715 [Coprinellus aureogranulatus]